MLQNIYIWFIILVLVLSHLFMYFYTLCLGAILIKIICTVYLFVGEFPFMCSFRQCGEQIGHNFISVFTFIVLSGFWPCFQMSGA